MVGNDAVGGNVVGGSGARKVIRMTDTAAILAAVADLPPAERVRIAQQLYERHVKGYGLLAPDPPLDGNLVRLHMGAATKRSALE